MINLKNRKVIVTGAASGIGKSISQKLAESGATVYAIDINGSDLSKLKEGKYKERIKTYIIDVSIPEEIEQFFINLNTTDDIPDSLVNNAGIYLAKSIFDYKNNEIDRVFNTNVKSAILFSKFFADIIISEKKTGCIVNISSVSGQEASSDAIYGLSKSALIGLTKSNALNFSPYIRVNAVAPGVVGTPMMNIISKERLNSYQKNELLDGMITPSDVANTVLFLLSNAANKYTGAVFDINNGSYLR